MRSVRSRRAISVLVWISLLALTMGPAKEIDQAEAGGTLWCKADPIVSLDGRLVDITASIPLEYLPRVTGPTRIEIVTPAGVDRVLILNDLGFNLRGSEVAFVDGGTVTDGRIPVAVRVRVPMDLAPGEVAPMEVTVWPDDALPTSVVGTNRLTTVRLDLEAQPIFDTLLSGLK